MKLCVYTNGQWMTVKTDPLLSTTLFVKLEDGDHVEMVDADKKRVWASDKDVLIPDPRQHRHQIDIIV